MNLAFASVAVIVAFMVLLWVAQRSLIYFPSVDLSSPGEAGLADGESVEFDTSDGLRLGAWFLAGTGRSPRLTVVVFNGNAGNRAYRAPLAAALRRHGLQVLLTDYRGLRREPWCSNRAWTRRRCSSRSRISPQPA
jgi:hypothetical protein